MLWHCRCGICLPFMIVWYCMCILQLSTNHFERIFFISLYKSFFGSWGSSIFQVSTVPLWSSAFGLLRLINYLRSLPDNLVQEYMDEVRVQRCVDTHTHTLEKPQRARYKTSVRLIRWCLFHYLLRIGREGNPSMSAADIARGTYRK